MSELKAALAVEQEKGIHSDHNACMFRDGCRAKDKRIADLEAQRNELSVIRERARVAIEQLEAERDALKVQLGCIMKWATTDEDEPQTGFDEGYEAARRWVLEVGLCAMPQSAAAKEQK